MKYIVKDITLEKGVEIEASSPEEAISAVDPKRNDAFRTVYVHVIDENGIRTLFDISGPVG